MPFGIKTYEKSGQKATGEDSLLAVIGNVHELLDLLMCIGLLKSTMPNYFFHHDNVWWKSHHTSAVATAKSVELGYELLPHLPYSPDLAPCDFFLFPNLKKSLAGQKFESNGEVIATR